MDTRNASPPRHLAAVWFADIVGYSTLAAHDEERAMRRVERLQAHAREVATECAGRLVKALGDAVLAEFASTEAAVRAALALRDRFEAHETSPANTLRIGVHVGDVMAAPDGDLYGDGVNMAARLQEASAPGEVVVSGDVWRQIRQRSEYRFESRGRRRLKGLAEPVEVWAVEHADARGRVPGEPRARAGAGTATWGAPLPRPLRPIGGSWRGAAVAVLLVMAAIAGWSAWRTRASTEPAISPTAIAVMPFSIRGSQELAYLGEGMVSLLSTKLDGAGELRAIDPRALLTRVSQAGGDPGDPTEGRAVAERFGAGWYVMGDILEIGGRIRVNAALYDGRRGERAGQHSVEGAADDVFSLVDQLAAGLLADLKVGAAARVDRIAAVTTSSLPALKAYLEGQSAMRVGDFGHAVEAFQRAVAADTVFALGYYRLSIAAEWLLRPELSHQSAERAWRLADRLSERDRRLLEAFSAFRRGRLARAENLYRALLGDHPDDFEAWLYLGELLFHTNSLRGRSPAEAEEPFNRVLDLDRDNTAALVHLARLAASEGRLTALDGFVQRLEEQTPAADRLWEMRALRTFASGNPDEQARLLAGMRDASGEQIGVAIWDVALYVRDIPGSMRLARLLTSARRPSHERALGHAYLAHFSLARGQWEAARSELETLSTLDPAMGLEHRALLSSLSFIPTTAEERVALRAELERLDPAAVPASDVPSALFTPHEDIHGLLREYLLGLVAARAGDGRTAEVHAERVAAIPVAEHLGSLAHDLAQGIRSHALRQQGRRAEALEALRRLRLEINYNAMLWSPIASLAHEQFALAELLQELGREEEALELYRHYLGVSPYQIPYLALTELHQAEIHEGRGEPERAARHYAAFLELWGESDPEFRPTVERARRSLARLEARGGR